MNWANQFMRKYRVKLSALILIGLCGYGCTALWFAGGAAVGAAGMHAFQQYRECPYCKKNINNAVEMDIRLSAYPHSWYNYLDKNRKVKITALSGGISEPST